MKTPTNVGGNNLITFLQNNTAFRMADLFTITLKNTTVLRCIQMFRLRAVVLSRWRGGGSTLRFIAALLPCGTGFPGVC